ncbi:MAG: hypothetical protein AVDCRST_MAG93-263, partial [uncultured Chloroflexia bacterium]
GSRPAPSGPKSVQSGGSCLCESRNQPRHDDRPRCGLPRLAVEMGCWLCICLSANQAPKCPDGQIHSPKRGV